MQWFLQLPREEAVRYISEEEYDSLPWAWEKAGDPRWEVELTRRMAYGEGGLSVIAKGTLTTGFSKSGRDHRYLRAKAAGGSVTIPGEGGAEAHSPGSLSAMIGCNCLVELPAGSGPVAPGEEVEVLYFVY